MTAEEKRATGLYDKYIVIRTDRSHLPGGKHYGCRYYVLDMTHDKHAAAALLACAASCEEEYPALAADLRVEADRMVRELLAPPTGDDPSTPAS